VSVWGWLITRDARIASGQLALEQVRPTPTEVTVLVPPGRILRIPLDRGARLWFAATWLLGLGSSFTGSSDIPRWWVAVVAACALMSFIYFCRWLRMILLKGILLTGATPETLPTRQVIADDLMLKEWSARFGSRVSEILRPGRVLVRRNFRLSLAGVALLLAAAVALTLSGWSTAVLAVPGVGLATASFRQARGGTRIYLHFREQAIHTVDPDGKQGAGFVGLFGPRAEYLAWCAAHGCDSYPFGEPPLAVRAMPSSTPPDAT